MRPDDPTPILRRLLSRIRHQVRGHEWGCYASEPCNCGYAQLQEAVAQVEAWIAGEPAQEPAPDPTQPNLLDLLE